MQVAKQISALLISLFIYALCFAQTNTIDSLKKILPLLKDTARIDCLNELGSEFSDRYWSKSKYQQTDTALFYTQQAYNESQQLHYLKGIGRALQNMSFIEEEHGNFKVAEDYTRKALPILQKENMQVQYHRGSVFLGWILHNRGFFAQSISIYKKELPYYEAIKDSEHIAAICRVTARAYDFAGNSENAFAYFQKDFAIQKKSRDAWEKMIQEATKQHVKIILLTPSPDQRVDIVASGNDLEQHARQIRKLAEKYHIGLADPFMLFQKIIKDGGKIADYMSSVNHPNKKGHEIIADEIMKWF